MEKLNGNNQVNNKSDEIVEQEQENTDKAQTAKSTSGAASAFIFLAVVFSLAAGGAAFLLFQSLESTRAEFIQKLEKTRSDVSDVSIKVSGDISGQLRTIADKMGRITADQQQFQSQVSGQQQTTEALSKKMEISNQQMRQSIDVLFKQKGRERIGWVLAEVEYLLLIANHSLKLQNDAATAVAALEAADSRLLDTGDPGTIEARTQIRDEIQQLKALRQPDIVGMAARLASIIKMLPSLPVQYTQVNTKKKIADLIDKKASHDTADLEQAGKDFLHELRGLVVFRKLEESPRALMTPGQQFFLQQNLQLKLETARRSLLSGQKSLFVESLNEAAQWLNEFFDLENSLTKQTIEELQSLQKMTITSKMPDISGSIKILRAYQKALEKQQEVKK
ncbi:MAG: uroporphyrinogen-III C-methyltransferase [gamma proteobacterium symbiont of Bathyaustriella thionipta]|nr:uroporphyrinogen-III C-methyltransferase [gamma proteobacterium symbiont of Bathyaustriella thionipta]MCU7949964.1 uroporphyrinogen-III C-methyltransferase [gamma proteobacterium symbiont of Bathyaustriella thionipta]MCU7953619.1 uroporphyrinogen-III C-methyltransferase [gamma proteobacterium symbiont of Bathyaustriella thionipta]MCU7956532.1 uroporphyrinogen-III C-methyltransferase [gamma proteobacterium symbiont of Bathyaustriella thionipta]MCU7968795.1 uroporphyrinogen-III C-methyltransfe